MRKLLASSIHLEPHPTSHHVDSPRSQVSAIYFPLLPVNTSANSLTSPLLQISRQRLRRVNSPFPSSLPSLFLSTDARVSGCNENSPSPLPKSIPHVDELGATSAPLKSASFYIGEHCKAFNGPSPFPPLSLLSPPSSLYPLRT